MSSTELVLPRPGTVLNTPIESIPAPSESAFTDTFGTLLPAAQFISTAYGKAAFYSLRPISSTPDNGHGLPDRVVFVHGVQTPALGMLPLARTLQAAFPHSHCVLLDLWGHGLSETPIAPHEAALFHNLLDALLDQLRWPSAHFVSFSFGASMTAAYLAKRPERVDSMALVAPAGFLQSLAFTEQQQAYLRGGEGVEDAALAWIIEFLEGGELIVPADWRERVQRGEIVAEAVREWQMRVHKGHAASVVAMVRDGGVMDQQAEFVEAAKTGVRSLVVLGELDDLCSERDLRKAGFENVFVVPQVGHAVVREKVPDVARLVGEFWKKLE